MLLAIPCLRREDEIPCSVVETGQRPSTSEEEMSSPNDPRLWNLVCDSIAEGVFLVDEEWRILSFNAAAERLTGMPREQALGMLCHQVFGSDLCQRDCALHKTLRTGEPVRDARVVIRTQDGREVPVAVSTTALRDEDGTMLGGVEIIRDLSALEHLERQCRARQIYQQMVGASPAMQRIFAMLPDVARSDLSVLIQGPSGTGKELVARALHRISTRSKAPFVQVNCGALPDTLLESELFGVRKGAYTGACRDSPGRFVSAHGGTLFLDEIGDTTPAFQVKLLRALQEGEVQALGAARPCTVDVRIVSATNKDLAALVREGLFREDLYYRLRVIEIDLPALSERREDIALLLVHLLERLGSQQGRSGLIYSPLAMQILLAYNYPGNVREMENIIQRALALSHGPTIEPEHLPIELRRSGKGKARLHHQRPLVPGGAAGRHATGQASSAGTSTQLEAGLSAEGRDLLRALREQNWNRERAARALGIGRTTLWRRMKVHGLLS